MPPSTSKTPGSHNSQPEGTEDKVSDIKLVPIKKLSVGSRFRLPNYADNEVFEIIGRARPSGSDSRGGPPVFTVMTVHKPTPDSVNTYDPRYFDIETPVQVVRFGGKSIDAIDARDMPSEIETIDDVAAREGVNIGGER